jgi:glutamate transport system ATP-binding protein
MGFARKAANRMVFMDDGAVIEDSDPETFFENPKEERLRTFLGQIL